MALQPANCILVFSGHRKIGGKKSLTMIGYNPDALDPKIRTKFPLGVGFTFEFSSREISPDGLPKDESRDQAFNRRDAVIAIFSRLCSSGIHVGDVFFPGKVRHQLQLNASPDLAQIKREIVSQFGQVRVNEDSDWSFFTQIVGPTAVEREYAENRDTLIRIEESGVEPGSKRPIDFQFTGPKTKLQQLSELLAYNGYAVAMHEGELVATKPVSLDWWTLAENCADVRGVAQEHGCKFAGWGT